MSFETWLEINQDELIRKYNEEHFDKIQVVQELPNSYSYNIYMTEMLEEEKQRELINEYEGGDNE